MSDPFVENPVSRRAIAAACALAVFAVVATATARYAGVGLTPNPPGVQVRHSLELVFADRADGAVEVRAAADGRLVEVVEPGVGGFVRGVMRGLARERRLAGIGVEPPFRLVRWADGRLTLDDTATGRRIHLDAFGPTNTAAFAVMLEERAPRGGYAMWRQP